jgi:hypothetical protein
VLALGVVVDQPALSFQVNGESQLIAGPHIIYVQPENLDPDAAPGDGTKWSTAFNGLRRAIDNVNSLDRTKYPTVELRLLSGLYFARVWDDQGAAELPGGEQTKDSAFVLPRDLIIRGGYVTSNDGNVSKGEPSVLSGRRYAEDNSGRREKIWKSNINWRTVVSIREAGTYLLEDLRISEGLAADANAATDETDAHSGGGVVIEKDAIVTMKSVTVANNLARTDGGGIFNEGKLRLVNCTIAGNTCGHLSDMPNSSGGNGGGIWTGQSPSETVFINTIVAHNRCLTAETQAIGSHDINRVPTLDGSENTNSLFGTLPDQTAVDEFKKPSNILRRMLFPVAGQEIDPIFLSYRPERTVPRTFPMELNSPFKSDKLGLSPTRSSLAVSRAFVSNIEVAGFALNESHESLADKEAQKGKALPKFIRGSRPRGISGVDDGFIYSESTPRFSVPAEAYVEVSEVPDNAKDWYVDATGDGTLTATPVDELTEDQKSAINDLVIKPGDDWWMSLTSTDIGATQYPLNESAAVLHISKKPNGQYSGRILSPVESPEAQSGSLGKLFSLVADRNRDPKPTNDIRAILLDTGKYETTSFLKLSPHVQVFGGVSADVAKKAASANDVAGALADRNGSESRIEGRNSVVFYCQNSLGVLLDRIVIEDGNLDLSQEEEGLPSIANMMMAEAAIRPLIYAVGEKSEETEAQPQDAISKLIDMLESQSGGSGLRVYQDGFGFTSEVTLSQVALSQNTSLRGGAIWTNAPMTINHSSIANNFATTAQGGGGIAVQPDFATSLPLVRSVCSVFANNKSTKKEASDDVDATIPDDVHGPMSGQYNFVSSGDVKARTPEQGGNAEDDIGINHGKLGNRTRLPNDWVETAKACGIENPAERIFLGPTSGSQLMLTRGSPLVDCGMSDVKLPKFDLVGKKRRQGQLVDIGAYEYPFDECPSAITSCLLRSSVEIEDSCVIHVPEQDNLEAAVLKAWQRNLDGNPENDVTAIRLDSGESHVVSAGEHPAVDPQSETNPTDSDPADAKTKSPGRVGVPGSNIFLPLPAFVGLISDSESNATISLEGLPEIHSDIQVAVFSIGDTQGVVLKNIELVNQTPSPISMDQDESNASLNLKHATGLRIWSDQGWPASAILDGCSLRGWTRRAISATEAEWQPPEEEEASENVTTVLLVDSEIVDNHFVPYEKDLPHATSDCTTAGGGAVFGQWSKLYVSNCFLAHNSFRQLGKPMVIPTGGAILTSYGHLVVRYSELTGNSVSVRPDEVGAYNTGSKSWNVGKATHTSAKGGAICVDLGHLRMDHCTVIYNEASNADPDGNGWGAGLHMPHDDYYKRLEIRNSIFARNQTRRSDNWESDIDLGQFNVRVLKKDGTTVIGVAVKETDEVLTVKSASNSVAITKSEIEMQSDLGKDVLFNSVVDATTYRQKAPVLSEQPIATDTDGAAFFSPPNIYSKGDRQEMFPLWHKFPDTELDDALSGPRDKMFNFPEDVWIVVEKSEERRRRGIKEYMGATPKTFSIPFVIVRGGKPGTEVVLEKRSDSAKEIKTVFDVRGVAVFRQVKYVDSLTIRHEEGSESVRVRPEFGRAVEVEVKIH